MAGQTRVTKKPAIFRGLLFWLPGVGEHLDCFAVISKYRTNNTPNFIENLFYKRRWFAAFAVVRFSIDPGGRLCNPSPAHFAKYHVHNISLAVMKT